MLATRHQAVNNGHRRQPRHSVVASTQTPQLGVSPYGQHTVQSTDTTTHVRNIQVQDYHTLSYKPSTPLPSQKTVSQWCISVGGCLTVLVAIVHSVIPPAPALLLPLLLVLHQNDQHTHGNGHKVNKQVQSMLDVVHVARTCTLHHQLCIKQHIA